MKVLSIVVILILLNFCLSSTLNRISHFEEVQDHQISLSGSTNKRGLHHEEINLKISAFGTKFSLSMVQNTELFTEDSKVLVYGDEGVLIQSYPTPLIAYKEMSNQDTITRITIFEIDKLKIKGAWVAHNETYYIDPVEDHKESIKRLLDEAVSHIIYKESDLVNDQHLIGKDGAIPLYKLPKYKRRNVMNDSQPVYDADFIPTVEALEANYPPPSPCPPTLKSIIISSSADNSYTKVTGGQENAKNQIINNFNIASALYEKSVHIQFKLNVIDIRTTATNDPTWNSASCPTIQDKLDQVSQWRGSQEQTSNLWHLSTNCYPPPGTVGLAWLGVTCMTNSVNGGSSGWFSGTGVSTYLSGSDGYRVLAHEVGHNFNAQHEQEGIMLPSLTKVDYFSSVTQGQMCQHIQSKTSKCYKDATTTCTPNCAGKTCGSNGCGGTCGSCSGGTLCDAASGTCKSSCIPNCAGKTCGSNGCGGTCGSCSSGTLCDTVKGICTSNCIPQCSGKNCGSNGCGGTCGSCPTNSQCNLGVCTSTTQILPDNYKEIILNSHNTQRSKYNIAKLTWDSSIEKVAKDWSSGCYYGNNRKTKKLDLGENIAAFTMDTDLESMMQSWSKQVMNYDCNSNKCIGTCSQFLQMVHQDAESIGCYISACKGDRGSGSGLTSTGTTYPGSGSGMATSTSGEWKYLVCNYSPYSNLIYAISKSNCRSRSRDCSTNITCNSQGLNCGYTNNGCDSIYCGECPVGSQCENGFCKCKPFTDCKIAKKSCGNLFDGCNTINCGSCSGSNTCAADGQCKAPSPCNSCKENEKCVSDKCLCTPNKKCPSTATCGSINDGCSVVQCGACSSGQQCINFTCSSCVNCHMMATCKNNKCQCMSGYIGDGTRCLPVPDTPANALTDWTTVQGSDDWKMSYNSLDNTNLISNLDDGTNVIAWKHTNLFTKANISFSVDIKPQSGAREWGLIFRQKDNNYLKFTYKNQKYYRGYNFGGTIREAEIGKFSWPVDTWKRLKVISDETYHLFAVNDQLLSSKYWNIKDLLEGNVGLFSDGPVSFENVKLSSSSRVTINLLKCMSTDVLKSAIQKIFNVPESSISDIQTNCNSKRDISEIATATFTLIGNTEYSSSTGMVSELTGKALSGDISLEANSISFEEPIVSSVSPSPDMILEDIVPSSSSLSSEAIIGLSIGVPLGAIVIAGAIYAVLKTKKNVGLKVTPKEDKSKEDKPKEDKPKEETKTHNIKMISEQGINLDPFNQSDPRNHSITARTMQY
jgi:hypothetical protein